MPQVEMSDEEYIRILEQKLNEMMEEAILKDAAIADLRDKAKRFDWEGRQRAESDKLGESIIEDMKRNKEKYLP